MIDGPVIQTYGGEYVSPLFPHKWTPRIDDIAHALSNLCRFTGHVRRFYSVCEHSCRVADLLPPELRLAGLLHDASEAYLGDMSRPLKHHPFFGEAYRDVERALQARIYETFGLGVEPDEVKDADNRLLATEVRDLMVADPGDWKVLEGVEPLPEAIVPWSPEYAKSAFMFRYYQLARVAAAA